MNGRSGREADAGLAPARKAWCGAVHRPFEMRSQTGTGAKAISERLPRRGSPTSGAGRSRHACVLAYWHRPRFSSGSTHGSSTTPAAVWNVLYNAGTDVSGATRHNRAFARSGASVGPVLAQRLHVAEIPCGVCVACVRSSKSSASVRRKVSTVERLRQRPKEGHDVPDPELRRPQTFSL